MQDILDRVLTISLAICAIGVTGTVLHREFGVRAGPALPPLDRPTLVTSWKEAVATGIRMGDPKAPVQILEFADLECPYCRVFHRDVSALLEKHPKQVAVVFVHFPLPAHRFAMPAARAVECGSTQGKAAEIIKSLYEKQDSIGIKTWGDFAAEAGIRDTAAFRACAVNPAPVARIDAGKSYGASIGVNGTPTVLINGWRYGRSPSGEELEKIIETIGKGGSPGDPSGKAM